MTKGLDDFPPAARTTSELAMRARLLIRDAMGACNALNEALTDEQRNECEHLIGYAHDGLSSAEGYLETAARRIAGDEHWPVPIKQTAPSKFECMRCLELHDGQTPQIPEHSPRCPMREERARAWDAGCEHGIAATALGALPGKNPHR